jgi:DNA-binding MarR family transcriptional regulator
MTKPGPQDAVSEQPPTEDWTEPAHASFSLHSMPGHLVRRLQQVAVSLFVEQSEAAGFDLTPVQYAALLGVKTYPGLDQASLARLIAYDRTTIGGVIDRLESKGLIRRELSPADRRVRQLFIEAAGDEVLVRMAPTVARAQERILDPLNHEERTIFMILLLKLVNASNERSRAPMRPVTSRPGKRGCSTAVRS